MRPTCCCCGSNFIGVEVSPRSPPAEDAGLWLCGGVNQMVLNESWLEVGDVMPKFDGVLFNSHRFR